MPRGAFPFAVVPVGGDHGDADEPERGARQLPGGAREAERECAERDEERRGADEEQ